MKPLHKTSNHKGLKWKKERKPNFTRVAMGAFDIDSETANGLLLQLAAGESDAFLQVLLYKLNNNSFTVIELAKLTVLRTFLDNLLRKD